ILTLELLQISLSCFLSHREKNIADKLGSAGTAAGGPHHLSSPARLKQIFISLGQLVRFHTTAVLTQVHEIDVGAAPETLGVFQLRRIFGEMRRIKSLHESCTLHHTRRSAAADHVDIIPLGLVFGEHSACNVLRIAAEEVDLDEGILFFK